ncbi:ATP-grasp domain-containing protein [Winogradskyella sp. R77965]|uniref:ATP-grasp domain-containing protein n=1 Tax=Winogradskyella sp. R77965 TaxID=3093872 RepID=UPI0037DDCB7A
MSSKSDFNCSVLIPDGEHALLFQVVSCLSACKNVSIHVLSNKKNVPISYSRHLKSFNIIKTTSPKEWLHEIDNYVLQNQIDIILPIQEKSIEKLIKHRTQLKASHTLVPFPSLENYKTAIDKANLATHLTKFSINCPKTIVVVPGDNYPEINQLGYPIIAKPSRSIDGYGIKVLSNKDDTHRFLKSFSSTYVLQEFIEGYDIDCSVLCKDGVVLLHIIQKGILFENRKFAPAIGLQFLQEEKLLEIVRALMTSLKWTGVAHIDLRYDKKTKVFKVIEVNGRFWGSMEGALAAGYNFPYLYCLLAKNIPFKVSTYKKIKHYNIKGLVKLINQKPSILFNWSFLRKHTTLCYIFKDPLPTIARFIKRTRVILRRR